MNSHIYRVFPPDVSSNTCDFEVRPVIHAGRPMQGVFARHTIDLQSCSVFIGVYPGHRKSKADLAAKVSNYASRHAVERTAAIRQTVAYCLSLQHFEPGLSLDPTDDEGNLLPEFTSHIANYLNEPPPDRLSKAVFAYSQPRRRYEIWLTGEVSEGEEVFLFYGRSYLRDYPINAQSPHHGFLYFIPAESILKMDLRPPPAWQVDVEVKSEPRRLLSV